MKPPRGHMVLAVALALLALNAFAQVLAVTLGRWDDPPLLVMLQMFVGVSAAGAALASWTRRPWAAHAVVVYGLVTAGMLVALGPILEMDRDERGGLWMGAGGVLLLALGAARFLWRTRALPPAVTPGD